MPSKGVQLGYQAASAAIGLYSAYKSRSGSETTTMRPSKNLPVLTEPGEYTKKSRTSGRYRRRTLKRLWRLQQVNTQPTWYRYSGKNRFNALGGFYGLPNHLNTALTPNEEALPVYIFELTQCPNFGTPSVQSPLPFYTVRRTNAATPTYQLIPQNAQTDTGSGFNSWIVENQPGQITYPGRAAVHKYSDIRMMVYGATQTPIKYDVSIVSFPDDSYNPFNQNILMTGTGISNASDQSPVMIDYLLAQYAGNPINIQDSALRKYIKYHFRENFIIQPGSTTDGDQGVPHFRELRIFKKWDQITRFDWIPTDRADPQLPVAFMSNNAPVAPTPNYVNRKYLMIRATSAYTSAAGPFVIELARNGTFDLLVRNKWEISFGS